MKTKFLLMALGTVLSGSTLFAQGVHFFGGTLDEAVIKAKADGKRIFMDFYTDWCGPCKAVAQYVFPTEEAGEYFNAKFINMSIDAEKGMGIELAKEFKVGIYPTFMVLDADRNVLARWSGGSMQPKPADFIKKVETEIASGQRKDPMEAMMPQRMETRERPQPGIVEFEGSYSEALVKAKAEGKMLFVDCYTQWCGPCKIMSADVFPREDVGNFINPKFVFMKLDMEHGEGPELNKTFRVRAYPTYVALDGDGNELFRFDGYKFPDAFIARINAELDATKKPEALQARYDAGERDHAFLRDYIAALSAISKYNDAKGVMLQLMSALTDQEKCKSEYWIYWTLYDYARSDAKNLDFLVNNQYQFEVGKKEVTDFFVKMAASDYSAIGFVMPGQKTPSADDFARADELVRKFNLVHNLTVELYRAAASAKMDGNIDGLIDTYEKCGNTVLSEYEQNSFLNLISITLLSNFSEAQRSRLAALAKDEQTKKRLLGMNVR